MKKGFTLIELLGVIIILSLVFAIVFPSIINFIKDTKDNQDELTTKLIFNEASRFIKDNKNTFKSITGNIYCISLKTLIDNNYLSGKFELDGTDITNTKTVKAIYTDNFTYEIVDSNVCVDFQRGELPNTYQQVEYIQSNGTQYIDTGYVNLDDYKPYKIEAEFKYTDVSKGGYVFGTAQSTANRYPLNFGIDASKNAWIFGHYGYEGTSLRFGTSDNQNKHIVKYIFNEGLYFDNELIETEQISIQSNSGKNIGLFARIRGTEPNSYSHLKLYSCKFYEENDLLVRYFVPCYRKIDNVSGLYDVVNNVFYTSSVGDPFEVGPNVEE